MQKNLQLTLSPEEAGSEDILKSIVIACSGANNNDKVFYRIIKRSIDARQKQIKINLSVQVSINEKLPEEKFPFNFQNVSNRKPVHIIGCGPAGLFAAMRCIELGFKPIIFERGKDVKSRRRDLAQINKNHIVNPESNYCFGEGGAGTYSDGKLYTRSGKRGDIDRILKNFIYHGANPEIRVDAHPHIGTNKLPGIIENIRRTIIACGGEIHFQSKLTDFQIREKKVYSITIENLVSGNAEVIPCTILILATGHSARDIYELLHKKQILLEYKPFAMGVRAEHPQWLIDSVQYHCNKDRVASVRQWLPAASYSLVHQHEQRGVYSFCMCPGGIIAPCATGPEQVVTNGWSPSKRNNPFANSGIVVSVMEEDIKQYSRFGPLAGLYFQMELEKRAWLAGGMTQSAPAQRMQDFVDGKSSSGLPECSYQPGIVSADLAGVLGKNITLALREGFKSFGKKMKGYLSNEAVLVAVESRTSTPVRIPRDKITCMHPEISGLYPCAEGAGYAGGIVSAAMDGEKIANAIAENDA